MSAAVHSISEHPQSRIGRLVRLLVDRQRAAQAFLDARDHTAAESERIAYALDARLVLHPDAVPAVVLAEQRRAALLRAIEAEGGRWKTGRAIRLYRRLGYGPVGKHRASQDLKTLRAAGHLVQHDRNSERYFELTGGHA